MTDTIIETLKPYIKNYYRTMKGGSLEDKKQYTCPNPSHPDKHPSATFYENKNAIYCHKCGQYYDLFNLIQFKENINSKEAYKIACDLYLNTQVKDKSKFDYWHEAIFTNQSALDFIFSRGFNTETIQRFKIGYANDFKNIVIPITDIQYTVRNLENDKDKRLYKKINGGEDTKIFNWQVASAETCQDYCYICEGEFDAMSFEQIGLNAVGLRSTENYKLLFDTFTNKDITFILALDNDNAGNECKKNIISKLNELDFKQPLEFNLGIYKDPNEMLIKEPENFSKQAHSIVDKILYKPTKTEELNTYSDYDKTSNYFMLNNFESNIENSKHIKPYSTGFTQLDKYLCGGIRPSIYVIGAISSIGKTTFCMQIADNIAKQGLDILIFSLEMSTDQLIGKSLSRITFENNNKQQDRKTTAQISNAENYANISEHDLNVINSAKSNYRQFANNIFVIENENGIIAEDILSKVDKHIKARNKVPVVVVDFMQLISATSEKFSDKQNMDKLMAILKKCVNQYKTPILLISSINRDGYTQKISIQSLKESGGIEYCAEVVLGLQYANIGKDFDIDIAKRQDPREIELIVLKNRFGPAGDSIYYNFYPAYNFFQENTQDSFDIFK